MDYKLGKLPAKRDKRNIKFVKVLDRSKLPTIPDSWDIDKSFPFKIPSPMFANNQWGCCVMAERAHQTLRFEAIEQKRALNILDSQVLSEYWKEQGGDSKTRPDNGLCILDSLKLWRSQGWLSRNYNIYAFAEINRMKMGEIKTAIFLLSGVCGGVMLPQSAMDQFDAGQPWSVTSKGTQITGGHGLYWKAFTPDGIVCKTWGKDQFATWEWFFKYTDELYGIVDNKDHFLKNSPVDVGKLNGYLKQVTS